MIAYELALKLPPFDYNAYVLHQLIWQKLLTDQHIDYAPSLLYRIVEDNEDYFALLRLPLELRNYLADNSPIVEVTCPISSVGQRFLFNVRLCPIYRTEGRYERTPTDLTAWATALFLRHGFEVAALNIGQLEESYYAKPGLPAIAHKTYLFSVLVSILDIALAQHAWLHGIGRRKNTGCGMLVGT